MRPLFSVVTVVYNSADKIGKTIESVLNQKHSPYEYIIIDGLSKDNTLDIINSYNKKFQEKNIIYKIVSEEDNGIYNAMNKAIKIAAGDFISFINAGDWYETEALLNIAQAYSKNEFDMAYGGLHYINPNGSIFDKMSKLDRYWITSRHWNHPSMFLKKEYYEKYMFDESYKIYSDFALYLKLRKDNLKIQVLDKVISNFVADGVSTNTSLKSTITRVKEKYRAYIESGYSRIYIIEAIGWEVFKSTYFTVKRTIKRTSSNNMVQLQE